MGKAPRKVTSTRVPKSEPGPAADRVLVPKPEHRKEFSDRRVEMAYEIKEIGIKLAELANEAEENGCDVMFGLQRSPANGKIIVVTQVALKLLK